MGQELDLAQAKHNPSDFGATSPRRGDDDPKGRERPCDRLGEKKGGGRDSKVNLGVQSCDGV
jgi:hypothetical protein